VVLLVAICLCRVPLPYSIVSESVADIRVRIKPGRQMNLRKELILAVGEYVVAFGPSDKLTRPVRVAYSLAGR